MKNMPVLKISFLLLFGLLTIQLGYSFARVVSEQEHSSDFTLTKAEYQQPELTSVKAKNRSETGVFAYDLSGNWEFSLDPQNQGVDSEWFNKNLDDSFRLPGSNVENLKGNDPDLKTRFTGSIYDSSWYYNPRMEKYRRADNFKMPFWLTQNKYYQGVAWYNRSFVLPLNWNGKGVKLFFERAHYQTRVWIDGKEIGSDKSLNTPQEFDASNFVRPGKKQRLSVRIDNTLKNMDVGTNSHSVTDHTQGNWNGIVGRIEFEAHEKLYIDEIQVFPNIHEKTALVKVRILNPSRSDMNADLKIESHSFNTENPQFIASKIEKVKFKSGEDEKWFEMNYVIGDQMQLWDEFTPVLYQMHAELRTNSGAESIETVFGMREIGIDGKWIYINGRKTQLRGTVENALFPLTGYPPMDEASWERVFRICKAWGLNHMRFHSYCPPEACFKAADKIGFYLQPEGPSWPNHSTQLGRGYPIDTYLMDETKRMVKYYGNSPSFAMLACGNEPRGPWVAWVSKFVDYWKNADSRRIYTGASVGGSWAWQPKNMYHVKAGIRDITWERKRPESISDFSDKLDTIPNPYISHETGQWCVFPNFDEIGKYTGITRAKNFELFKEDFYDRDLGGLEYKFLMASGKLQTLCYKHTLEKHLRTPDYEGFQLLSLNDYSGQGTALVGLLDAFWDEKGYVKANEFRRYCNRVVPLTEMEKFVFRNNEILTAKVHISQFDAKDMKDQQIVWRIKDEYGNLLHQEELGKFDMPVGQNFDLGKIEYKLNSFTSSCKLNLEVVLPGTEYVNDWDFWVYPDYSEPKVPEDIYVSEQLDQKSKSVLKNGGKVLLLAAGKVKYGQDVKQYYQPAFWNTSWFKMRPPHTTGVYINNYHPVFRLFTAENWANLNWWELVNKSQTILLENFPKGFRPIVQPIDTWFINRKLGMLLEASVDKGKIMMCSMDLLNDLKDRPVAESLYHSILNYMNSSDFRPEMSVGIEQIEEIFTRESIPFNMHSTASPDELKQGPQKPKR